VAYKPGLALNYERTVDSPSTHLEIFFRLGKPTFFQGRVLNQDKKPIVNAKVQMRLKSGMDNTKGISIPSL